jgi:nucleoid DNA-binding protein
MAVKKKAQKSKANPQTMPIRAITAKQTKSEILRAISKQTGLSMSQVRSVLETTSHLAKCHIAKKGSGEFSIPEMAIKVVRKTKPATKAREGRNPITGETITISAKPKREVIKIRPLKSFKEILL